MQNLQTLYNRFLKMKERRQAWENLWKECYDYALPQRERDSVYPGATQRPSDLFDGTAEDAVVQLASSMFAELTPPWSRWFNLKAGANNDSGLEASATLEKIAEIMQYNFDLSNFALEVHQCFLDVVTAGTASLLFEEARIGDSSAFHFKAVPLTELYIDESASGRPDITFRRSSANGSLLKSRFPLASLPDEFMEKLNKDSMSVAEILEAVLPRDTGGYEYTAFIISDSFGFFGEGNFLLLKKGVFSASPFINFRWQKVPGEVYGRSPVMSALPDIKTANKVVELILKNAAISVTGIWQAEDDGVLNPANIKLIPGAIIPKAVGSKGLTPLQAAGNFDVSQLVLSDLRERIRHTLLNDRLGQINSPVMTATEVLERSAAMARILGATYGRIASELLTPIIVRAINILNRRGEISPVVIDGRAIKLEYASPLARKQARESAQNILYWISSVAQMGQSGFAAVNLTETARKLGQILGVPQSLIKSDEEVQTAAVISAAAEVLNNLNDERNTADGK